MGNHFHIEGVPPFDGDHPIDLDKINNRDLHTIKQLANVRAGELEEAFEAGDNDLLVALAVVALRHAGHAMTKDAIDVLWEAPVGKITLVVEEDVEEADGVPPASAPPSGPEKNESGGEKTLFSGGSSSNGGDLPQNAPSRTGAPNSDTSAELLSETSA